MKTLLTILLGSVFASGSISVALTPVGAVQAASMLSGAVVSDGAPSRPIPRAIVTATGLTTALSRSAITDEDGRFEIRELPAGSYSLVAERPGFITSAYGSKRPGRLGTAVVLDGGQDVRDLRIQLWTAAVITGVVVDEMGTPLRQIPVKAVQKHRAVSAAWQSLTNNGVRTNDAGQFRIYGLEPGDYILVATPPIIVEGSELSSPSASQIDSILAALQRRRVGGSAGNCAGSTESGPFPALN